MPISPAAPTAPAASPIARSPICATLDVGYGYSPDGGRTFPLRGRGVGGMPTVEEVLQAFQTETLIFTLVRAARRRRARRRLRPRRRRDRRPHRLRRQPGRARPAAPARPAAAGRSIRAASDACLSGYRAWGWLGIVPESCRGTTVIVPRRGAGPSGAGPTASSTG